MAPQGSDSSTASIPSDLIGEIIDLLDDDLASLMSCSLVCKDFLPFCRRHVFGTICFLEGSSAQVEKQRFLAFQELIESNPDLLSYPRSLKLCFRTSIYIENPIFDNLCDDSTLPKALRLFSQLEFLSITGRPYFRTDARKFSGDLTESLLYILSLDSLKIVELGWMDNLPTSFLRCFRAISHLTLDHLEFAYEAATSSDTIAARRLPAVLHTLNCSPYPSSSSWRVILNLSGPPSKIIDLSKLHTISCIHGFDRPTYLGWRILERASQTLTRFHWHYDSMEIPEIVDIGALPCLQELDVSLFPIRCDPEAFQSIERFFAKADCRNGIQTISLTLDSSRGTGPIEDLSCDCSWEGLDEGLGGKRYANLSTTVVRLLATRTLANPTATGLIHNLQNRLSALHNRGILKVEVHVMNLDF